MKKIEKRRMAKAVEEDFSSVFEIISRRRDRALMAVNVELLMTYWEIGAFLSPRIHAGSWDAAVVAHLRREGLIEGRMPHPHISAVVAEATGQQAEYMRKKELPGSRYRAMLIDYIGKFNGLTRKQINDYMIPEIRGELSIEEKTRKITNLLTYLRQKSEIKNIGTDRNPLWVLSDSNVNSNVMSERYSESMGMK